MSDISDNPKLWAYSINSFLFIASISSSVISGVLSASGSLVSDSFDSVSSVEPSVVPSVTPVGSSGLFPSSDSSSGLWLVSSGVGTSSSGWLVTALGNSGAPLGGSSTGGISSTSSTY